MAQQTAVAVVGAVEGLGRHVDALWRSQGLHLDGEPAQAPVVWVRDGAGVLAIATMVRTRRILPLLVVEGCWPGVLPDDGGVQGALEPGKALAAWVLAVCPPVMHPGFVRLGVQVLTDALAYGLGPDKPADLNRDGTVTWRELSWHAAEHVSVRSGGALRVQAGWLPGNRIAPADATPAVFTQPEPLQEKTAPTPARPKPTPRPTPRPTPKVRPDPLAQVVQACATAPFAGAALLACDQAVARMDETHPRWAAVHMALGEALISLGRAAQGEAAMRVAAEAGDMDAHALLALRAEDAGDAARTEYHLKVLAEAGDAESARHLGLMYAEGLGVAYDPARGLLWLRRAAEAGDAEAQHTMAWMLMQGRGMPADPAIALGWFRRAAEAGHTEAQYQLAVAHAQGRGAPLNVAEALHWAKQAAATGHQAAAALLRRIQNQK